MGPLQSLRGAEASNSRGVSSSQSSLGPVEMGLSRKVLSHTQRWVASVDLHISICCRGPSSEPALGGMGEGGVGMTRGVSTYRAVEAWRLLMGCGQQQ